MQHVKKYGFTIAIIVVVVALVLAKTLGRGHFKNDAEKWARPSFNQSNLITTNRLKMLSGKLLIIDLSDKGELSAKYNGAINIPAKSIFEKANQRVLRNCKGSIVLVSDNPALSARMWMLLSQMGYKQLYILNDSADNELLKYKFNPDVLIRVKVEGTE